MPLVNNIDARMICVPYHLWHFALSIPHAVYILSWRTLNAKSVDLTTKALLKPIFFVIDLFNAL